MLLSYFLVPRVEEGIGNRESRSAPVLFSIIIFTLCTSASGIVKF